VKVHIDIETFSEANLKTEGLYRYAQHPSTDLSVLCWAEDDGPVNVWMPWKNLPQKIFNELELEVEGALLQGHLIPQVLQLTVEKAKIAAHNAQFERVVLNNSAGIRHSVPHIRIENTICTMAKAAVHGLPAALEHAAKALGTFPKRESGANEMRYFAKPRKDGTRPTPYDETDRFITLVRYCIDDVKAERDLDKHIPDLTEREQSIYFLDQKINERGIGVDIESVENAMAIRDEYKEKLAELCHTQTGYKPTQTGALAEWIRANGYPQLKNLQAPTVDEVVKDSRCPDNIKKLLRLFSTYNMKAVTKFDAMLRAVCDDGRLHGMLQYYGAGPGRWSSRIVQLQNMMRPVIKDADNAIEELRERNLGWLRWLYHGTDVMKVLASCTRGMLVAGEGKDLMAYDFAQIESRIQAWLAGAEWKLKFFREGKIKIYNATGSLMFGIKPEEVVDSGEDQLYTAAKIGELACGYQGWAVAIEKFARQMGIKLNMDPADIAGKWREANSEQVQLWYDLTETAMYAVKHPGEAYAIPNKKIMFKVEGRWLYMRLPSGRRIAYLDPEVQMGDRGEEVTYMGIDTYSRKWTRVSAYGGKWLQNACEGIGRDLLVSGLMNMEDKGYKTTLTVHDEGVFEVPEGFGSDEEAMRLMTVPLEWADGLPVKCEGWRGKRYRK